MASEPKRWDGGPDFDAVSEESSEELTIEELCRLKRLFSQEDREIPSDYHGYYNSEIESLVESVDSVSVELKEDVKTTPYIEFLLENATTYGKMVKSKDALARNDFPKINYGLFSDETIGMLYNFKANYESMDNIAQDDVAGIIFNMMDKDIENFRRYCDRKAHRVMREK